MNQGRVADTVTNMAINLGNKLPENIENRPILDDVELVYLDAYKDLDSERSHSMGLTRIPWSSIQKWTEANKLNHLCTFSIHHVIRTVDNKMLAEHDRSSKSS